MTIREYFRARSRRARRFLLVGSLLAAVSVLGCAATQNLKVTYCYAFAAMGILAVSASCSVRCCILIAPSAPTAADDSESK